jgi:serine-type D-Ala-D-Ala carboxypeptidase
MLGRGFMRKIKKLLFFLVVEYFVVLIFCVETMDYKKMLNCIDGVVNQEIERNNFSGAVISVGSKEGIFYRKAFGLKSVLPEKADMTVETIFDLASLTKVIATATSIMILLESGLVDIDAPVVHYLPEFGLKGKDKITVKQLLLHSSGLSADIDVKSHRFTSEEMFQKINNLDLEFYPGEKFVYSDIGYIILGELIQRVSGYNMHDFSQQNIFKKLEMLHTTFNPSENMKEQVAPTEMRDGTMLQGKVHDPKSSFLGGISGHAGLFSTVKDLEIFCTVILNKGTCKGVQILKPEIVKNMIAPQAIGMDDFRSLGWDVKTRYSWFFKEFFPFGTIGHLGFTGTSILIDVQREIFFIILTNRVHPDGKGNVADLRKNVSEVIAKCLGNNVNFAK